MARIFLAPEPASAARARRFMERVLEQWGLDAARDTAVLLTSEVVTNAIVHARSQMELTVHRYPRFIRVEVWDANPKLPAPKPLDVDSTTGRGLPLVDFLSRQWDSSLSGDGKVVWFDVGLT